MTAKETADKFYASFSQGNANEMLKLYHPEIEFADPAFGTLKAEKAHAMWRMLLSSKQAQLKISYTIIDYSDTQVKVNWIADYYFGPKKRKVKNNVIADLTFQDGKVIKHTDSFDLWKWSRQALGISGFLPGWSGFLKRKIQERTNKRLINYMNH